MSVKKQKEIEPIAERVLSEANSSEIPVNVLSLATKLRLTCKPAPLGDEVSGLLVYENGRGAIAFNSNHPLVRQRFTIAHEIGHFILHASQKTTSRLFVDKYIAFRRDGAAPGTGQEEIEANYFAAALLMPRLALREMVANQDVEDENVVRALAKKFQVSVMAMTYRLLNVGLFEGERAE